MNVVVELEGRGEEYVSVDTYDGVTVAELKRELAAQGVVETPVDAIAVCQGGELLDDAYLLEAAPMGPDVRVEVVLCTKHLAADALAKVGVAYPPDKAALLARVERRDWEAVEWILRSEALSSVGLAWRGAGLLAEFARSAEVVEKLIEIGAIDVTAAGVSPLAAVCRGQPPLPAPARQRLVDVLLAKGAPVGDVDDFGIPPLLAAIQRSARPAAAEELAIVRALLRGGADANRASSTTACVPGPLEEAVLHRDVDLIDVLLAAGAAPNDHRVRPALHHAAELGDSTAVDMLLAAGADPGIRDREAQLLPIDYAAREGRLAVVATLWSALSRRGFDGWPTLQQKNTRQGVRHHVGRSEANRTPLHWAAQNGHTATVQYLIENGARVNARDREQAAPLYCAALGLHVDAAQLLLDAKACPNGCTVAPPLPGRPRAPSTVSALDAVSTATAMVSSGAALPLAVAAENSEQAAGKELVRLLLSAGASPNVLDTSPRCRAYGGLAPLHFAARAGDAAEAPQVVALLLEHGADPNLASGDGHVPLHFLAMHFAATSASGAAQGRLLDLFLKAGADTAALTSQGRSVRHYLPDPHPRLKARLKLHHAKLLFRRHHNRDCAIL
eukprot:TRINITY_DN11862_c0_g3_i1.p1 TRINITY_DN11862_c0_g3~~TRINITY_DN11862_c0_g3_i1.p1  ORF type:complete len:616 (+),score=218.14 TRINITY_DN11862_c0_g3_i1:75-1922(+)